MIKGKVFLIRKNGFEFIFSKNFSLPDYLPDGLTM